MTKSLRKNQDISLYKEIADTNQDLIVRVDLNGEITFANENFTAAYAALPAKLAGAASPHFNEKNSFRSILSKLKRITEPPYSVHHEEKLHRGKTEKYIYWENAALFDEDKNITGIQSVGRDITELKKEYAEHKKSGRLIGVIAKVTQTLIESDYYKVGVKESLAILGEASRADAIYLYELQSENGKLHALQIFDWMRGGENQLAHSVMPKTLDIERHTVLNDFFPAAAFQSVVRKIEDSSFRKFLENLNIKSVLFLPISVRGNLWGFLVYSDTVSERVWSKSEINFLTTTATVLGSAIQKEQLKEKLRNVEAQYRFALEVSGFGVWALNLAGKTYDYSPEAHEAVFTSLEEMIFVIHPEDKLSVKTKLQNFIAGTEQTLDFETRMMAVDGTYRYIRMKGIITERNSQDKPVRLIGTYQDLTEERLRAQKVEENEAKLKSLISVIPDNIFILTEDGVIEECYANDTRMLLSPYEDFIKKRIDETLPPDVAKESLEKIKEALRKGKTTTHFYKLMLNGKNHFFEARIIPIGSSKVFSLVRNETDRINIEEELYDSQKSLEKAQEIARMGSWEKYLQTGEYKYSKSMYNILGLDSDANPNATDLLEGRIHPESKEAYKATMSGLIEKKQPFTKDFKIILDNGDVRYLRSRGDILTENGNPVKIFGTFLDITDIWLAEKSMRESEQRYKTYIGQSPVAIIVFNIRQEIIEANHAAYELLGNSAGQLPGKYISDIIHPDSVFQFKDHYHKIIEHGKDSCNLRIISGGSALKEISISSSRLLKNEFVAFMQDITATRQMIRELAENKARFDNYFSSLNDLVYFYDLKTRKSIFVNDFRSRIIGLPDIHNDTDDNLWLGVIYPEDKDSFLRASADIIESKKSSIQYRVVDREGKIRWLWDRNWLVCDEKNEPVRVEGIITDITTTKEYEEAIKVSLEKEKELNEMKSRFITTASHEFRTPLTAIFSSTELLENYAVKWPKEKSEKHYKKIKDTVHKMRAILDELILINKAETGNIKFEPVDLDLDEFLKEMIEEFTLIKPANIEIRFTSKMKKTHFMLDINLLTQILRNLLGNAIKFSPKGGTVALDVKEREESLIFTVTDEGIGVPADEIRQLFNKFYRTKNAAAIDGTGLGLVIAKNAVEAHGGHINCLSKESEGTTFIFVLPVNYQLKS